MNPTDAASSRPRWRASTMSASRWIGMITSSGTAPPIEVCDSVFEIERRLDPVEGEAELDHRDRDVGLDPDHDGLRATQPRCRRDVADRTRRERVEDIERG